MNCKKCKKEFAQGEMVYSWSDQYPLCYTCAKNGEIKAVTVLAFIVAIFAVFAILISTINNKLDIFYEYDTIIENKGTNQCQSSAT